MIIQFIQSSCHFTQEIKEDAEDFVLSMSGSDWLEHLELMEEE